MRIPAGLGASGSKGEKGKREGVILFCLIGFCGFVGSRARREVREEVGAVLWFEERRGF